MNSSPASSGNYEQEVISNSKTDARNLAIGAIANFAVAGAGVATSIAFAVSKNYEAAALTGIGAVSFAVSGRFYFEEGMIEQFRAGTINGRVDMLQRTQARDRQSLPTIVE